MFCGFGCVITDNMIIVNEIKRNKSTLQNMVHIIQTTKKLYLKVNLEYFLRPRRYKLRVFRPSSGRPTSVTFIHLPIIGILRKIQDISTLDNSASGNRSRSCRVKVRVMAGGQGSYFRAFFFVLLPTSASIFFGMSWQRIGMFPEPTKPPSPPRTKCLS